MLSRGRLQVLSRQLLHDEAQQQQAAGLVASPCSAAVRSLPRFDPYILETYLDDLREMKRQVYDLFKFRPELLPGPEMSKGEHDAAAGSIANPVMMPADCSTSVVPSQRSMLPEAVRYHM